LERDKRNNAIVTNNTEQITERRLILHKSIYIYIYLHIFDRVIMENTLLTQEVSQLHADICSALADPKRILLIYAMAEKPRSVNELAELLGISQPATSRSLKVLRERGLAYTERQGTTLEYHLTDMRLVEALNMMRAVLRDRLTHNANLIERASDADRVGNIASGAK
jgi:DNA-binding transcriptional ArsR family regulator